MTYALIALAIAVVAALFLFLKNKPPAELPPSSTKSQPPPPPQRTSPRKVPEPGPNKAAESVAPPPVAKPRPEVTPASPEVAHAPLRSSRPPPPPSTRGLGRAARDIDGLRKGLSKARASEGFFGRLRALFSGKKELGVDIAAELEEVLLSSDVGAETSALLLARVKDALSQGDLADPEKVWDALRVEAERIVSLDGTTRPLELRHQPTVILLVGVNGAGKTTTIGKLATKLQANGKKCLLAAGDTFRAAAVQQLVVWGDRIGCEVVRGKDGADPGSVVFDAIKRAETLGVDVVLADTAGRLHTKSNLMAEMKKIAKTAEKALAGAPHEILLVIDATNGQNALAQAKEFQEALPLTGIVLTKLDGTAKGGVVLGIANALRLPVRFVGLGERPDDLHEFAPADFVEALLGREAAE
ncbi:MAG TPA: signal recognition particle-docking protein FtsY [Polyangiaceae bacterium]|nr:signal recognition particle-docking protein FtsY [Polyangiaceae bacterium]